MGSSYNQDRVQNDHTITACVASANKQMRRRSDREAKTMEMTRTRLLLSLKSELFVFVLWMRACKPKKLVCN